MYPVMLLGLMLFCNPVHGLGFRTPLLKTLSQFASSMFQPIQDPELYYNTEELIHNNGYPVETHHVRSDDGYILRLHRIPHGKVGGRTKRNAFHYDLPKEWNKTTDGKGKKAAMRLEGDSTPAAEGKQRPPVLLQHGLAAASDSWLMKGPDEDLAYMLADAGYDVWLSNARGNYYVRDHASLDVNDDDFWDFSFHEMGAVDLPNQIDHILNATEQKSLYYVGHSMGTTMFFVMAATRPHYTTKIRAMFGLAPVGAVHAMDFDPAKKVFFDVMRKYLQSFEKHGVNEILPRVNWVPIIAHALCRKGSPLQDVCSDLAFVWAGVQSKLISKKKLVLMLSHVPAGSSLRTFNHYAQMMQSNEFRRYDHGAKKNMELYGVAEPPLYDLSDMNCPVSLHYSSGDHLVTEQDVAQLMKKIPNLVHTQKLEKYNHLDFLWANTADEDVYHKVMEVMDKYNS